MSSALIADVESAVTTGSSERRAEMLRRVTRLLPADAERVSSEQLAFIDDVLLRIVARVEASALTELSTVLAGLGNAPARTVAYLAQHDDIAVAGPVLTGSNHIVDNELIAIAQTRGPAHMMALAERQMLSPEVTDVLLQRADTRLTRRLGRNTGARFSDTGYASLVRRAESDEILTGVLGIRPELPPHLLRQLLLHATDAARERLLATAVPAVGQSIRAALAGLAAEFSSARPDAASYSEAERHILALNRTGKLTSAQVNRFALDNQTARIIVAIAVCCSVKPETIEPLLLDVRPHDLVVACKAAGLSWQTTQMILMSRVAGHTLSRLQADEARATFESRSLAAAQCEVQSWAARAAPRRTA